MMQSSSWKQYAEADTVNAANVKDSLHDNVLKVYVYLYIGGTSILLAVQISKSSVFQSTI